MKRFDTSYEFRANLNKINALANDDGATAFLIQMNLLHHGGTHGAAVSAYMDLLPDITDEYMHDKIFNAINQSGARTKRFTESAEEFDRRMTQSSVWENSFPSQFENLSRRHSFGILLDILEASDQFRGQSYEEIADTIFKPYVVYDGGGQWNHIYKKTDLDNLNIEIDDLYDNQNYAMILAMKEGKDIGLRVEGDDAFMADKPMRERLKLVIGDFKSNELHSDASVWTATQPSRDGKNMEVVLMGGDMNDRNKRVLLARWQVKTKDKNGKTIFTPLTYDGKDRQLKLLSAYKRGNFMDIDNDDDVKNQVRRWIKEGPSSWLKSIPGGFEEVMTEWWSPINIGQFEFENVVKPFWDKYKHLSDRAFADKWEEVRRNETYSWEEKFFDWSFEGLIDTYRPDIVPFRHGAGRYSKTNDPLGNRGKLQKQWLLLKQSGGKPWGGKFNKSGRSGWLHKNEEGKYDPFGITETVKDMIQ